MWAILALVLFTSASVAADPVSGEKSAVRAAIFTLHFRGQISVDLSADLNRLTPVRVAR
jgi:hypothetical protein